MLLYFFRNMHLIKINLCAEVAEFFFIAWKQNILCNHRDMDAEFATGSIYFYFWLRDGKIIKCIFPSRRRLKNIFFNSGCGNLRHHGKNYKNYFFLPEKVWKTIKSIFVSGCGETCGGIPSTMEKFIKNILSSGRSGKYYKKYFLSLCYFIFSATYIE